MCALRLLLGSDPANYPHNSRAFPQSGDKGLIAATSDLLAYGTEFEYTYLRYRA